MNLNLSELLPVLLPGPLLLAFLGAALVLAVTPGPGVLYIVARTLAQGRGAGMASVAGVALGNLANAVAASLGLAAVLLASDLAFAVIKYAGAAYLVWLGVMALRARAPMSLPGQVSRVRLGKLFRDGFVVALLNPKTTLFFAAFLPQFIDPARTATSQAMALSALFVAIAACSDSGYVLLSRWLARRLAPGADRMAGAQRWGRYLTAGVYLGLGAWAAVSSDRPTPRR